MRDWETILIFKGKILLAICCLVSGLTAYGASLPAVRQMGNAAQLIVDGKPYLILGGRAWKFFCGDSRPGRWDSAQARGAAPEYGADAGGDRASVASNK